MASLVGCTSRLNAAETVQVIAHRGASFLAPETTRASYWIARELGADFLEMDIQRSKDGVLFGHHDDDFARATHIEAIYPDRGHEPVGQFTWAEIQRLEPGVGFNLAFPDRAMASFAPLRVISFEELLRVAEAAPYPVGIYLESKGAKNYPGIEREMVELLRRRGWLAPDGRPGRLGRRVIFQSFEPESLARFAALSPQTPRTLLIDRDANIRDEIARAHDIAQGIGPHAYLATPWSVRKAHQQGLFVHPYVLNGKFLSWVADRVGVDGVFTDQPEAALIHYGRLTSVRLAEVMKAAEFGDFPIGDESMTAQSQTQSAASASASAEKGGLLR